MDLYIVLKTAAVKKQKQKQKQQSALISTQSSVKKTTVIQLLLR